jgi:hypothetical protein
MSTNGQKDDKEAQKKSLETNIGASGQQARKEKKSATNTKKSPKQNLPSKYKKRLEKKIKNRAKEKGKNNRLQEVIHVNYFRKKKAESYGETSGARRNSGTD